MQNAVKRRKFFLVGLLMCMMTFLLAGCRQIKPITNSKQVRDSFTAVNTSLATAEGTIDHSSYINTKTKQTKLMYKRTDISTLKAQEENLDKVIASFNGTNHRYGLPKHTLAYAKSARAYIDQAINAKDPKELESGYHEVVKQGVRIFSRMPSLQKNRKDERLMASVMAFDAKQARDDKENRDNKNNSASTDNSPSLRPQDRNQQVSATADIFSKRASKGIPFSVGITLIVISVLIIVFIFLQPSKANDAMSALSDTAGHDLLSEAKPDDYTLFLMRGTVVLTLVLIGILGYLEFFS